MTTDRQILEQQLDAIGADCDVHDGVRGANGNLRFERGWYTVSARPHATPAATPRRLIFCIDGTWNDPTSRTNVARIARCLDSDDDDQIVRYYDGVGMRFHQGPSREMRENWQRALASAAENWTLLPDGAREWLREKADSKTPDRDKTLLAGGLGIGIDAIRRRVFFDLATLYRPGDEIVLFGFSRGATIARLLARQIATVGMPELVEASFRVSDLEIDIIDRRLTLGPPRPPAPTIAMLGVWDTVASYIVPGEHHIKHIQLDLRIPKAVRHAVHLVAIDERRAGFFPSLMAPREGVEELWFRGVHTNVGGGYTSPETGDHDFGIADITLAFMIHRAQEHGIRFLEPMPVVLEPDPNGPIAPAPWKLAEKDRVIHAGGIPDLEPTLHKSVRHRTHDDAPPPLRALDGAYEIDERD